MTSGFGSIRRFNDLFQKRYRLSPTRFRRETETAFENRYGINVELGYRPPYRWQVILDFLALRVIPGVELVQNNEYMRTVKIGNVHGFIRVANQVKRDTLAVTVSEPLLPVLPEILARVWQLFDLYCDPAAVFETSNVMNDIKPG
jgi:AraC family transcriptional regulator of adaptative response / DNA-3-methyladenine glycosylase II